MVVVLSLFLSFLGCRTTDEGFNFGAYSQAEKFYEKGKYDKAIEKYQEFLRENQEGNMGVIAQYYMAKSYEGLGRIPEARELYEKIAKENPKLMWADFSKDRLKELNSKV